MQLRMLPTPDELNFTADVQTGEWSDMTLAPRLLCTSLALIIISGMMSRTAWADPMIVDWQIPDEKANFIARGFSPIPGVQSELIYDVTQKTDGLYNHHPAITRTDGGLIATWSNHLQGFTTGGEEGPGQKILYTRKPEGEGWAGAAELFPSIDNHGPAFDAGRVVIANGFAHVNGSTYAIAEVSENQAKQPGDQRVRTGLGRLARQVQTDGTLGSIFWLDADPPAPKSGFDQFDDPGSTPSLAPTATAIKAYLAQPLNEPAWDFIARNNNEEPVDADGNLMVERSAYQRPDGSLVRLFRDSQRRGFLFTQTSSDDGQTWTQPEQTNVPDSPSKTVSGTLPDGRVYVVGNQINDVSYGRDPLTLAISRDGVNFDWAAAVRYDAPKIDFPGDGKGPGFQYPSVTLDGDEMVVTYSIGKEDVAVSRFAIPQFADRANETQLLVASSNGNRITRFDGPTGRFVEHFDHGDGDNPLDTPAAMRIGPDGLLYVVNRGDNRVLRYDPISGEQANTFVDGQGLDAPTGLAFTAGGDLLVSNRNNNNVLRFAGPDDENPGAAKGEFITAGSGGLDGPFNMATGPDGKLYVASFDTNQILRFDGQTGAFDELFASGGLLDRPQGLLFDDDGNLLVASTGSDDILRYAPDGSVSTFIDGEGLLHDPNDLTFGPDGNLYVSSRLAQQVLRFNGETGEFMDVFAYGAGMQGTTGIVFTAIPEPGTMGMLGIGTAALLAWRR